MVSQELKDKVVKQLIIDEDIRKFVYKDTKGILTIGIGRNVQHKGISTAEAIYLCKNDIEDCIYDLDTNIPWWNGLSDNRKMVMINMCFNLGIGKLLLFKKALAYMKNGNFEKAADEMIDSDWFRDVGNRAVRLANLMREG